MDALYYSIDGNFKSNLKVKKRDPFDVPLTNGCAYFADEDAFAVYSETLGPLGPEVRAAPSHENAC